MSNDDRIECATCVRLVVALPDDDRKRDYGYTRPISKRVYCAAWREVGARCGYRPVIQPRRCIAYIPLPEVEDQRVGEERWPFLRNVER
jgi:hypothetical protein